MLTKYKSLNQFKKLLLDKNEAGTTSIKKKLLFESKHRDFELIN